MADSIITKQELIDAQKDAVTLKDAVNGNQTGIVTPRLNDPYPTLPAAIQKIESDGAAAVAKLENTGGLISAPTLTALQAITPEFDYQLARVDDTGNEYRWNPALSTPVKWEATGRNFLSEAKIYTNSKVDPINSSLLSIQQASLTLTEDNFMNINGTQTASTSYDMYSYTLSGVGDLFVTTYCSGSSSNIAPLVFKNASGVVVGTWGTLGVDIVNQQVSVPTGATTVYINLRTANSSITAVSLKQKIVKSTIGQDVQDNKDSLAVVSTKVDASTKATSAYANKALTFVNDFFVTSGGSVAGTAGYRYAEVSILTSKVKITTRTTNATVPALVFKNASGAVVGTLAGNQTYTDYEVTVPAGATKAYLNQRNDGIVTPVFYSYEINESLGENVAALMQNSATSNWKNKAWASLGDSITAGATWQAYVTARHGLLNTNFGIGGTKISGTDSNAMCGDTRINAIATTFDLVTLMGGTNDWAQNVPLGTIDSTDVTTFNGALNVFAQKAFMRWPTKKIAVATTPYGEIVDWTSRAGWTSPAHNSLGLTTNDYAEAIRQFCKRKNLHCIDVAQSAGWGTYNITDALGGSTTDHLHPAASSNAAKGIGRVHISALQYIEPI